MGKKTKKVMSTPRQVDLSITKHCNLNCPYCYYEKEAKTPDLPTSDLLKFIEVLGKANVMSVIISGGEPFIRDDLFIIIDAIKKNRMRYSILSNGTLINDFHIDRLKGDKRLDYIQISLDGSSPEVHDKLRGAGSFKKTIFAIEKIIKNGIPLGIRTTLSPVNIDDFENIIKLILSLGIKSFSINDAIPFRTSTCKYHGIYFSIPERIRAMQYLGKLNEKYPGVITGIGGPLVLLNMCYDIINNQKNGDTHKKQGTLSGCTGIFNKVGILHDGTIVPCHMLAEFKMGNVKKDNFIDIWQNHPILKDLRNRINIPLDSFKECMGCQYINYCTGGCPGVAYSLFGKYNYPNMYDCFKHYIPVVKKWMNQTA